MENLSEEYSRRGDRYNRKKVGREMEQLESEFTEAQSRAQEYLDKTKSESSTSESVLSEAESARSKEIEFEPRPVSREVQDPREGKRDLHKPHPDSRELRDYYKWLHSDLLQEDLSPRQFTPVPTDFPGKASAEIPAVTIGRDMWTQLKRVAIPVFSGNKKTYESWKAAFIACIDKAPATPEYKLLQLQQYLSGEALKTIENLGHSGYAYEAAKERLERKFGGQRHQNAIRLEELENFKPLRPDNSKDLEDFADLLDIAVINLKEAGRSAELGDGSLYLKLQKKMTESMLTRYHRWVYENFKIESVETLREWVMQESQFYTIAHETVRGLIKGDWRPAGQRKINTFFAEPSIADRKQRQCPVCSKQHGVWNCDVYRKMTVPSRWETAKQHKLCYRCFDPGHQGSLCRRSRVCAVNGCRENHHRLLHRVQSVNIRNPEQPSAVVLDTSGRRLEWRPYQTRRLFLPIILLSYLGLSYLN